MATQDHHWAETMAVEKSSLPDSAPSPPPFLLELPAEIRNQIYRYTLTKPDSPIDLCPWNYIDKPREDDRLKGRLQKKKNAVKTWKANRVQPQRMRKENRQREKGRIQSEPDYIVVRHIPDLENLRTEMGAALLRTCKQIHQEASVIFWGENTWIFSGDASWLTIFRFLMTIGEKHRGSLRTIELHPTFCSIDEPFPRFWDDKRKDTVLPHMKNHPKLRMSKTGLWNKHRQEWCTQTKSIIPTLPLKKLRFVAAAETRIFHLHLHTNHDLPSAECKSYYESLPRGQCPRHLRAATTPVDLAKLEEWRHVSWATFQSMTATKLSIVIEQGARFDNHVILHAREYNLNVQVERGSFQGRLPHFRGIGAATEAQKALLEKVNGQCVVGWYEHCAGEEHSWKEKFLTGVDMTDWRRWFIMMGDWKSQPA